eukprot:jgi/Ulvmu1/11037/UM007_0218.1
MARDSFLQGACLSQVAAVMPQWCHAAATRQLGSTTAMHQWSRPQLTQSCSIILIDRLLWSTNNMPIQSWAIVRMLRTHMHVDMACACTLAWHKMLWCNPKSLHDQAIA